MSSHRFFRDEEKVLIFPVVSGSQRTIYIGLLKCVQKTAMASNNSPGHVLLATGIAHMHIFLMLDLHLSKTNTFIF